MYETPPRPYPGVHSGGTDPRPSAPWTAPRVRSRFQPATGRGAALAPRGGAQPASTRGASPHPRTVPGLLPRPGLPSAPVSGPATDASARCGRRPSRARRPPPRRPQDCPPTAADIRSDPDPNRRREGAESSA
ncbi:hypothetical protein DEJ32_08635 [Curtobacterium sp. MCPF17_046]|nr:hypothetical protein DEJ32_08635 [Curtobacterium sp. MCPF17_046]